MTQNWRILFILLLRFSGRAITEKYQLDQPWSNQLTQEGLFEIANMLKESNELISIFAMTSFPVSLLIIVIIHKYLK